MTIGGFKFSGRFCQRNSLSDTEWCLLMHKTRVKAFLDASDLSNAGWSFDQTDGDINFETFGNVIYTLDDVGYNYVSFIKCGSGNITYIAILTTCNWSDTADVSSGVINGPWLLKQTASNGYYVCANQSMSHRLSQSRLSVDNLFTEMTDASPLLPAGASVDTQNYGMYMTKNMSFPAGNTFYAGYSIKGEMVISWVASTLSASYLHFSMIANHGFKTLKIKDDTHNWFVWQPEGESSNSSSYGEAQARVADMACGKAFAPNRNGNAERITFVFNWDSAFQNVSGADAFPYGNVSAFGVQDDFANTLIKGDVKTDLLCVNLCYDDISNGSVYAGFANGNLVYYRTFGRNSVPVFGMNYGYPFLINLSFYCMIYLGWDPSNPDIIQTSSWTEYTIS